MEDSPINLKLPVVRPVHLDEVQRWRTVMAAEHYLGLSLGFDDSEVAPSASTDTDYYINDTE